MGMTSAYEKVNLVAHEDESLRTISRALELGINMLDTAWVYQSPGANGDRMFYNEELVGKAIKQHGRDKFVIATKFGIMFKDGKMVVSGKEETIRSQLADSLQRLGTDYIDLYYMHRMDPTTPIEETMTVLKLLVDEGKVKYIGLSECTPDELRRAHAVHPITAIQMEWSLQTRDLEEAVVPTARELGVGIVAYSPCSRGFLADIEAFDKLDASDRRVTIPRFNQDKLTESKAKHLAGSTLKAKTCFQFQARSTRIVENSQAALIALTAEEWQDVADAARSINEECHFPFATSTNFNARMNV
ncbi:hypothetical protein AC1031_003550 [Aphanomyces cochlioides]|nr:hypothetical protein AC1031_003550 [Aphanomyces cochlioides]